MTPIQRSFAEAKGKTLPGALTKKAERMAQPMVETMSNNSRHLNRTGTQKKGVGIRWTTTPFQ
jgi:hypothetical protein